MHHSSHVRIYLFRKLSVPPTDQQREVYEEAVAEVLGQVLGGHSSMVFCCGHGKADGDPEDIVTRICGELFSGNQASDQTEVSVRHVKLSGGTDDLTMNLTSSAYRTPLDQFVATPRELQAYFQTVKENMGLEDECRQLMFNVLVGQKSSADCGELQLIHLMETGEYPQSADAESGSEFESESQSESETASHSGTRTETETPLETLRKLLQALAHNTKTHLRYHNVRLTGLLKQLLGNCGRTVLVNFTSEPKSLKRVVAISSGIYRDELTATVWQAMYRHERQKYCCLREKVLSQGSEKPKEMEEFLEYLEEGRPSEEDCENAEQEQEQDLMQQKMIEIRDEAEHTIAQLAELRSDMERVVEQSYRQEQQLEQKNRQLARLSKLLTSAREELRAQRLQFKQKLAEDLGKLSSMCRLQSKMQMQVHRRHLSEVFDLILQGKQQGEATRISMEDEETDDEPPEKPRTSSNV
ncbi:uncharacterized protein LOC110187727 [Drosophila serrata]|uniref:uncharacterized protein LOC110187727 n=1 Tax=Drosophila serrata TaxID=7274 RepID=UPI000A1D20AA|nr:uncharacterized protein LOC110187727 [Drosophila serrata]